MQHVEFIPQVSENVASQSEPALEEQPISVGLNVTEEAVSPPAADEVSAPAAVESETTQTTVDVIAVDAESQVTEGSVEGNISDRLRAALVKIDELVALLHQKEQDVVLTKSQYESALEMQREEHFAFLELELERYKRDFTEALMLEKEAADVRRIRDIQEHLFRQKADLDAQFHDKMAVQAEDIKSQSEANLRLRLGSERSHRLSVVCILMSLR